MHILRGRTVLLSALLFSAGPVLLAQYQAPVGGATKSTEQPGQMSAAWDQVITNAIPQIAPDPSLGGAPAVGGRKAADDFLGHFFLETRTTYQRYQTLFNGNPTTAGVIDAPVTGYFNPAGIPAPSAFQPGSNQLQEFIDFGTRGWLSDRVNTHFALRYRQDPTAVLPGSAAVGIVEAQGGHRLYELLDASIEIAGKPGDNGPGGASYMLGRINVYGAELASFDGASVTIARPRWDLQLYGGRRFSFFDDPVQRAIGGANLNIKLDPSTSVGVESLWYVHGSNRLVFRKRIGDRWLTSSYFRMEGGQAVDLSASAMYTSRDGRDSFRFGAFQKLSDRDYSYDYTVDTRNSATATNQLLRLYLGPISKYTQFNIEGHHQILNNLRGGAAIVVRHLNHEAASTPWETSFRDFKFNGQYFPGLKIELFSEYHQRSSDRLSPVGVTTLDGLTGTGETSVKDLTGEIRRTFGEGRFNLSGGVYYRRISEQDTFYYEKYLHQSGLLGSAWVRLDRRTRVTVDYSLDNDFYLFSPDLKNSQVFRLGVNWKY